MAETILPKLLVSREEARQKIQAQIEKGEQLHDRRIESYPEFNEAYLESDNWSIYTTTLLIKLFDNPPLEEYTSFNYSALSDDEFCDKLDDDVVDYETDMKRSISSLEGIYERIELYDEFLNTSQRTSGNERESENPRPAFGDEVFIVHGHDEAAKHAIAGFVRRLGLNPIILDEQVNKGQTIIEKFEENANEVGFAIVLLTPDDVGAPKDKQDEFKPRARQNVVLELGYFMGKLGRERVCPLLKDEVEKPSDIDGLVYAPMNNPNEWQLQLAKEMKQAGLPIDLNKLA